MLRAYLFFIYVNTFDSYHACSKKRIHQLFQNKKISRIFSKISVRVNKKVLHMFILAILLVTINKEMYIFDEINSVEDLILQAKILNNFKSTLPPFIGDRKLNSPFQKGLRFSSLFERKQRFEYFTHYLYLYSLSWNKRQIHNS